METDKREMRILRTARREMGYENKLFSSDSILELLMQSRELNSFYEKTYKSSLNESQLASCAIIHIAYQSVLSYFLSSIDPSFLSRFSDLAEKNSEINSLLEFFGKEYPKKKTEILPSFLEKEDQTRCFFIVELIKANPAMMKALGHLMTDESIVYPASEKGLLCLLGGLRDNSGEASSRKTNPEEDIFGFLTEPSRLYPSSLEDQLGFIQTKWRTILGDDFLLILDKARGILKDGYHPKDTAGGPGPSFVPDFSNMLGDYELFSDDKNWMPNVVMIAKNTLVWLDQLSRQYGRPIRTLDRIPDEELDALRDRGFNALWLIGLWERSDSSRKIKNLCGNPEAEASAYSIKSYNIAQMIGSWTALSDLRERCQARGIRLASDMVPNHTGLDSDWMRDHKDYFISQKFKPFPSYSFNGPDLSNDSGFEVKIEDHYFERSDAAVVFRRTDRKSGEMDYIYHGNDGTTMPWNDTAQLNFLNPETREAVIQQILEVARNFRIIRFDAAMTLARKHIRRLWYPEPGTQPDIAGRGLFAMSDEEFANAMPAEFWREVVDRVAVEVPDTLLLAEAFWMMEGYFVRTLGMHRVYNSAFMNMLKNQENQKYRDTIKKTILFDPEILKRYVNFMNNPDEEPAIAQFGNGDKYFGVCTLLSTMPGLPMFGHGQIEGFSEKYGMEYTRAYWNEIPDQKLIERHQREIFPLLKKRYLFSNCDNFQLYDVVENSVIQESIYAYSNGITGKSALVLYNNQYEQAGGTIRDSVPKLLRHSDGTREVESTSLVKALDIPNKEGAFVLAKRFGTRISYLIPATKLHNDGLSVHLNGFETKVFTDIQVLEDTTGILAQLYTKHGGQGMIEDFDIALGKTVLAPLFDLVARFMASEYSSLMKKLIQGKATKTVENKLVKLIHQFYLEFERNVLMLQVLNISFSCPTLEETKDTIHRLARSLTIPFFRNLGMIFGNMMSILNAFLILQPIAKKAENPAEILSASERMMLSSVIGTDAQSIHMAALACNRNRDTIEELLEDRSFRLIIGANMYQGVMWFRSESFLCAAASCLFGQSLEEKRLNELKYEKLYSFWLEKVHKSKYILDNLASKD